MTPTQQAAADLALAALRNHMRRALAEYNSIERERIENLDGDFEEHIDMRCNFDLADLSHSMADLICDYLEVTE